MPPQLINWSFTLATRHLKTLLVLASMFLFACTGGESNVTEGNRLGILHYGNGSEPQGLDPHVVTGVPENHLIRALFRAWR